MIIEKIQRAEGFTTADQAIADYLLEHKQAALTFTSTELGKEAAVSQSAVIRFCRKLGYGSYRNFMLELADDWKERSYRSALSLEKPFHEKIKPADAADKMKDIYEHILSNTKSLINTQSLQRVYQRIKSAKQIDIYGVGISSLYAQQLSFDLIGYGYPCRYLGGENDHYIQNIKDPAGTVVIIYSFTGNNPLLNRIAQKCRDKRIYCIAFTSKFNTPLSSVCSESLYFASEYYDILDNIAAEIGAMYLNHVLLSMFLSQQQP